MKKQTPFDQVIEIIGNQSKLAKLLGKTQSTVAYWKANGIPAEQAVAIEKATNGRVPRWVCRPDLWEPRDE